MKPFAPSAFSWLTGAALGLLLVACFAPASVQAQDRPPERQIRTYIPPDQLVSFLPATPFDQFVEFINPITQRVAGKQVIDPESRAQPIGVSIQGMYFLDALELVLDFNGLTYQETDRFFVIQEAQIDPATGATVSAGAPVQAAVDLPPANLDTREIKINAILFDLNLTKAREVGLDWGVFLDKQRSQQGGGGLGGGGGATLGGGLGGNNQQQQRPSFFLRTDEFFDAIDDYVLAPGILDFADLASFFRLVEDEGLGETVANPSVVVQSEEQGRIQIGSDIPIQTRDFAGNTVTQFFSTGIIIDVTPTLIRQPVVDTLGAPEFEFIHLDVSVENSVGRPSTAGVVIDRNTATTQVLLLDGEQTIIGGLYSTVESFSRRGIPVLKDLPKWFFGLGYIFGRDVRNVTQRELLIVLQAELLQPLQTRAQMPRSQDLLERRREDINQTLRKFSREEAEKMTLPKTEGGRR